MNIKIQRLELTNFKCFRHKEFAFSSGVNIVRGRNGVGKTTISDAIMWCLFGKNAAGQSAFSVKTKDENANDIPHLDHSVELSLTVCGDNQTEETLTLKRTLKEVWIKKRGTDEYVLKNNTTEYLVNGESKTAKDYEQFIYSIISEELFRTITNPNYFTSLKWQTQRELLLRLVGEISDEDIAGKDSELREFISSLSEDKDVIAYRKHLSYQIKKIKDKLEKIPVRLEEQHKALPERLDWESLRSSAATVIADIDKTDDDIRKIASGNGSEVERSCIRDEIQKTQKSMDDIETQERNRAFSLWSDNNNKRMEASRLFSTLLNTQRDLENSIQSFQTLIDRCRQSAEDNFKAEQAYIRQQWPKTQADFSTSGEATCSLCGQPLPPDMLYKAEETFNQNKAELKQKLSERAAAAKKLLADAEEQVRSYENQRDEAEKKLADTKQEINEAFAEKNKLEKQTVPTAEDLLAENETYAELQKKKKSLLEALEAVGISDDDKARRTELEAQKAQLSEKLNHISEQLATKTQYDRIQKLIDDINTEEMQLVAQLSELERHDDVSRRYQDRQNSILESRVNSMFSVVRWRMFRTVNNGGDAFQEPYCECYVGGADYHDGLNYAERINAGLDIINTLCRHYSVTAPIVIDNAESNLNILQTESQQIRLQVFDSDLQVF